MAIDDRRRFARRALHVASWRGHRDIALLTPAPDRQPPTAELVATEVDRLWDQGVTRILTGALHHHERAPFLSNGFVEHERLHLLRHDLQRPEPLLPSSSTVRLHRARTRDLDTVLAIDRRAFDAFWTLDAAGLGDAIRATPSARYRVAGARRSGVDGYAVTGRAGDRGYLQRLAVDPDRQRQGTGRALVLDALGWLRRTGARTAVVNTQEHNTPALDLYRACGFRDEPTGLTVLAIDAPPDHAAHRP